MLALACGAGGLLGWFKRAGLRRVDLANARIVLEQGNPAAAARIANAALERYPDSYEALRILARASEKLRDCEQLRRVAERALQLKPEDPEPWVWKARSYRLAAMFQMGHTPQGTEGAKTDRVLRTLDLALAALRDQPRGLLQSDDVELERGLIHLGIADYHRLLQARLLEAANLAGAAGLPEDARRHAEASEKEAALVCSAENAAIESLGRSLNGSPSGAAAGEELQALYERRGLYDRVVAVYERLEAAGHPPERIVLRAVNALLLQNADMPAERKREAVAQIKRILSVHLGQNTTSWDARVAMGGATLLEGNTVVAGQIADEVLKHDAKHARALLLKARVSLAQRRYPEAKEILQSISAFAPNQLEIRYTMAIAQMGTANQGVAQQMLRQILTASPSYLAARLALAQSLWKSGHAANAEQELRDALRASRSNEFALPAMINLALQYGTADRATEFVDVALTAPRGSPQLLKEAANQYWRLGKVRKAQECLARVGSAESSSALAKLIRAAYLIEVSQPASAETVLKELLDEPLVSVEARTELAGLRFRQGRILDARRLLSETLMSANITASQRLAVAEAYLRGGDLDGALESVHAVLASDGQSYSGQMLLGQILQDRCDSEGAKTAFAAAEQFMRTEDASPEQRANLALLRGDYARCAEICETALQPGAAQSLLRLIAADALERSGRVDAAAAHLAAYISDEPANLEGYMRLVRLYVRANKPQYGLKALGELARAQPLLTRFAEGQVLWASGRPAEAIARCASIVEKDPTALAPRALRDMATSLATWQMAVGQLDDAVAAFNWLGRGGDSQMAGWGRFGLFVEAGRIDSAQRELRNLERLSVAESMTPPDFERLARAQLRVGPVSTALETARRYAAAFPELDGAATLTMEIEQRSGDVAGAIRTFHEALGRHGDSMELWANGVELHIVAHDFAGAERLLDQLSKVGATGAVRAGILRADMYVRLGLCEAAVAELTRLKEQERNPLDSIQVALGRALSAAGRLEESDAALRSVPPYSRNRTEAVCTIADNACRRGRPAEGLVLLKETLRRDPGDAQAAWDRARLHLAADQPEAALEFATIFMRELEEPAQRVEWMAILAELQWLTGDLAAAERTCRDSVGLRPQDETARLRLALLLLVRDQRDDAAKLLAETLTQARTGPAYVLLALAGRERLTATSSSPADGGAGQTSLEVLALAACGKKERAAQLLRTTAPNDLARADLARLIASATDDRARGFARRLAIGRAMFAADLREVGLQWARRLAADWQAEPLVWQSLREALLASGRQAEAEGIADRLRRQHADSIVGRELAAEQAVANGSYEEGWKILTATAAAEGETPRLCMKLGDLAVKRGTPADAVWQYQRAFELDRTLAAALNNTAYVLANSANGDKATLDRALDLIRQASSLEAATPAALETLGWIRVLRGENDEGLRLLSAAITSLHGEPIVHYHIGVAYTNAGMPELARLHLENVLRLGGSNLPERRLARELLAKLPMPRMGPASGAAGSSPATRPR